MQTSKNKAWGNKYYLQSIHSSVTNQNNEHLYFWEPPTNVNFNQQMKILHTTIPDVHGVDRWWLWRPWDPIGPSGLL